VREFSPLSSNWRSDQTAQHFLTNNGVPVISGIDTRALVLHLRSRGVMRGVLSSISTDAKELVERAKKSPSMNGLDLATRVSTKEQYAWDLGAIGRRRPPIGSAVSRGRL
jgi:carbamoyl-phosphate synthase small subunit